MIRMNDFAAEPQAIREAMLASARRVMESGRYILGTEVEAFERGWAASCGTRDAIGVANGMDAIEIGMRACGIGPGDEVITTAMTAFASVLAILRAGATPVLADIEPGTAHLSLESVRACVTPRTRAVLFVHLYGRAGDMRVWRKFCDSNGLHLFEDCAQAHLATSGGKPVGSAGTFGAYSFYPTKNLGALGDGGAIVTSDMRVASAARCLRNYGQDGLYNHTAIGLNSRLDEMQAALLGVRLDWLPRFTERRRRIAAMYLDGLANRRVAPLDRPSDPDSHVHHLFVVVCEERERLGAHLARAGIQSTPHYPVPIHRQRASRGVVATPVGLPNAERHAAQCLSIPCHPQLSDADVHVVIDAINGFD